MISLPKRGRGDFADNNLQKIPPLIPCAGRGLENRPAVASPCGFVYNTGGIFLMDADMKKRLAALVLEKAFKYSEEPVFKLVSGRMSNYYFNCKTVTLHPEGMYLIGNIVYGMVKDFPARGIGGLTLGADPISNAVAYTSYLKKKPIEAFVVRKTAKAHGTMQWIEGNIGQGDGVVIVDDVITTGKSTIEAIEKAKEAGLKVLFAVALIDRQEGGKENIESLGIEVKPILTREEVMALYRSKSL
jgi:orotate phosphoribosyltransferase